MQTTHHTVMTRSGETAEVAITAATTDAGERLFIVQVLAGPVASLTDISAWEVMPPRTETVVIDQEASKAAVEELSKIVAEPMAGETLPGDRAR
jgi:hypothetical protein